MQGVDILKTFNHYFGSYAEANGFTARTKKNYKEALIRLVKFLGDSEFSLKAVKEYQIHLENAGWKPSSVGAELRIIKAYISYLHEEEHLKENFGERIRLPKLKRRRDIIPTQEKAIEAIFAGTVPGKGDNSINKKRKVEAQEALLTIVLTGLRQIEINRLTTTSFDFEAEEFVVLSKGENEDILPLPRVLKPILQKRVALRTSEKHTQLFKVTQAHLNMCLKRGCVSIGIPPITVHKLRKIFGTRLARENVNPFIITRLMRHSKMQVTYERYINNSVEDLKQVVNTVQAENTEMTFDELAYYFKTLVQGRGLTQIRGFKLEVNQSQDEFVIRATRANLV